MQYTNSSSRNGHQEKEGTGMPISRGKSKCQKYGGEMKQARVETNTGAEAFGWVIKLQQKSAPLPPRDTQAMACS